MGCVSSRNADKKWDKGPNGHDSPISTSSFPEIIHVCRIKSTVSFSNLDSDSNIPKSRLAQNKSYTRSRLDSINASASTDASLPVGRFKFQRERRYTDA